MIKVKALVEFTLGKFNELKNIERINKENNEKGKIYAGDIFDCDKKMADYLTGGNENKISVVEIIEVEPEVESKIIGEKKVVEKKTKNKKTSKK